MMKRLLLVLILFIGFQHFTQANTITDSLQLRLNGNKDTLQVAILDELCWQFSPLSTDSAVYFGEKALEMAKEIHYAKGESMAYSELGVAYYYAGNSAKAIVHFKQALELKLKLNDKYAMAALYNSLSVTHIQLAKYTEALYYNLLALRLFEEIKDETGVSTTYNNIGLIYYELNNIRKARFYHQKALEKWLKLDNHNEIGSTYLNIGNTYNYEKNYPIALEYYLKAYPILEHSDNPHYISAICNNVGNIYVYLKKPALALFYLKKSIKIREEQKDEKGLVFSYMNMADAYYLLKDNTNEAYYLTKTIAVAEKLGTIREASTALERYARAMERNGDYKNSTRYLYKYIALQDSIYTTDVVTATADMQTKYETEKKEAENKSLTQENEIQDLALQTKRTQIVLLFGSLILVIVVAFLAYTKYKHKKEKELSATLIKEEQRRTAAVIYAQEDERKRISAELHDGIGQMLSVVKMNMSGIEEELPLEKVRQTIQLLDESCTELRNISHHLMPAVLIQKGLVLAVLEFVNKINASGKLHISYYHDHFERTNASIEINLYRILQELTNNIIKYAQATEVNLNINHENGMLKVMVSDNGIGMDPKAVNHSKGNGWNNIYSRLNMMHARYEIDSSPGNGTTIFLDIPLQLKEDQQLVEVMAEQNS
jgi:two-component system NarL family sensor kinase